MCIHLYKPNNPEHWMVRQILHLCVLYFLPEAWCKHITFASEVNYCTQDRNSWWGIMACCFTRRQSWRSNCSFKSPKQQISPVSRSISNHYSKSPSQAKYSVSINAYVFQQCPKIFLWKYHDMGNCGHMFRDPQFLGALWETNSWIYRSFLVSVSFSLWLMK